MEHHFAALICMKLRKIPKPIRKIIIFASASTADYLEYCRRGCYELFTSLPYPPVPIRNRCISIATECQDIQILEYLAHGILGEKFIDTRIRNVIYLKNYSALNVWLQKAQGNLNLYIRLCQRLDFTEGERLIKKRKAESSGATAKRRRI